MLKKLVVIGALLMASTVALPTTAKADGNNDGCLLNCFPGDGGWVCPNPADYMNCREP